MIKTLELRIILAAFPLLLCTASFAEENSAPLTSLPSVVDYTNGNGWAGGIGAQIEFAAEFNGSDHSVLSLKPEGAVQWRSGDHMLFWEGFDLNHTELGWRGLMQNKWLIESGVRHEIVIPSSYSRRAGINDLPHRGSHILGFFDAKHSLGSGWKNWVSGRLQAGSGQYGWQAKISAGHTFLGGPASNGAEVILFSTFGSEDNINNYFGVSEFDSAVSGLQEINLKGGYRSSGLNIIYRKNVSEHIQITAKAGIELYSSEIKKSELVGNASETSAGLSVTWIF